MLFYSSLFDESPGSQAHGRGRDSLINVGVATIDITPETPIRLAGFAAREKSETNKILRRLSAKALVFGEDIQHLTILMTVDLIGIQWRITKEIVSRLSKRINLDESQIAICVTHTHGGPEIGNLINILQCRGNYPQEYSFSDSKLDTEQLNHIAEYNILLIKRLEEVALAAIEDRKPSVVAWGKGKVTFATNRRSENGPVDHTLMVMGIANPDGIMRAIFANYACHGIALGPEINEIHGDWIGSAQDEIESLYPGAIAMLSIGCAGDQHPRLQGKLDYLKSYGIEMARQIDEVLKSHKMQVIKKLPATIMKRIKLPFHQIPTITELIEFSKDTTVKGYYSKLLLERILKGETISAGLEYPVQVWHFGDNLVMINMGGEPVLDYAIILKKEMEPNTVWINAYANDVSCYIPSKRVLKEGGYEACDSMYWYNQPSPFSEKIEDLILNTIHEMVSVSSIPEPLKVEN